MTPVAPTPHCAPRQASPKSLAHNLAVLHIVAVCVGFTLCSVLLYLKLLDQLQQSSKSELQAQAASVRTLLEAPGGAALLKKALDTPLEEEEGHRVHLRMLDRQGFVVLESPVMKQRLPIAAFPPPGDRQVKKYHPDGGSVFLIRNACLKDPVSRANGWRLQLALDIKSDEELAASYRKYLLFFALSGLLFSLLSSTVVVRRGLKPLNELSGALRDVSDSQLNTRMDPASFPVEMHSLVRSFNSMMARLEDSFQRLSHCAANLAHELRTPINTLMLEAEIALSKQRSEPEYREVLASCLDDCQRLSLIVDRLLFLARADGKHHDLWLQKLELQTEVAEVLDYFVEEAREAGIRLVSSVHATVYADQTLVRRALSNLVGNAITHTPAGGQISLSTGKGEDGSTELIVCDTGCGIEAEHLPLLFDRFYRVGGEAGGKHAGTGLGLAIVKAIMLMHGGDVAIWSEPGQGTVVTLRFCPTPS